MLKEIIGDEPIKGRRINDIEEGFPTVVANGLQFIMANTKLTRPQRTLACRIALNEYAETSQLAETLTIVSTLTSDVYAASRQASLEMFYKTKSVAELKARYDDCQWFVLMAKHVETERSWSQTASLWLNALLVDEWVNAFIIKLKNVCGTDTDKRSLIAHIVAHSALEKGLRSDEAYQYHLKNKTEKLIVRLNELTIDELVVIARLYPGQPSPSSDVLLRLIKTSQSNKDACFLDILDVHMRSPDTAPRLDYGVVSSTRDADLKRMIGEIRLSGEDYKQELDSKLTARMTLVFSYLNNLESGSARLGEGLPPLSSMSKADLNKAFFHLSKEESTDLVCAKIWAIIFEVMGRTTHKYPNLAQQFALIACDLGLSSPHAVLQLATGEGKSHIIAARAARLVGKGQEVNCHTAKRVLATRDREDYKEFFSYFGIKTAYVHPRSDRTDYTEAQVRYTTIGDLSLFLAEQSFRGYPISFDCVTGLFDEFDFTLFDEGEKTEYNFASPTGVMPKQMIWLYEATINYYLIHKEELLASRVVRPADIASLTAHLAESAGSNENKLFILTQLLAGGSHELLQLLRSAHQACSLTKGKEFTTQEVLVAVGDEVLPLQEIIPLSRANQRMVGSSFSNRVHSLLATRLNMEAKKTGESQNHHIHPESHVICSQVAGHLISALYKSTEGFSGTVSASQIRVLDQVSKTQVMHVPTNRRDLRHWVEPQFYSDEDNRVEATARQLRDCIDAKQSVLFAARDDCAVQKIKSDLLRKFGQAYLDEHFIFYTNEERRGPQEVLDDKREMEQWSGGAKQKAVCLVASGFTRGDNCDVDVVVLHDVNDDSDRKQKGGCTARNGAPGVVYQYYRSDLLSKEHESLCQQARLLQEGAEVFDAVPPDESVLLEQVLLLREYVGSLKNVTRQEYRVKKSELCGWVVAQIGAVSDEDSRQNLISFFRGKLRDLDKGWFKLSISADKAADEKIVFLGNMINQFAREFIDYYKQCEAGTCNDFVPEKRPNIGVVLGKVDKTLEASVDNVLMQQVNGSILRVQNTSGGFSPVQLENIRHWIEKIIDAGGLVLQRFSLKVAGCKTSSEFMTAIQLSHASVVDDDSTFQKLDQAYLTSAEVSTLYSDLPGELSDHFHSALGCLTPYLKAAIIKLAADPIYALGHTAGIRIARLLPIVQYLATFIFEEQEFHGAEYAESLPGLLRSVGHHLIEPVLKAIEPVSFGVLEYVLLKCHEFEKAGETGVNAAVMKATLSIIKGDVEQRKRKIERWEAWTRDLPKEAKRAFYVDFCQLMSAVEEGRDLQLFEVLVNQTQSWWGKNPDNPAKIAEFWRFLSGYLSEIPGIAFFVEGLLRLENKNWYKLTRAALTALGCSTILCYEKALRVMAGSKAYNELGQSKQHADSTQMYSTLEQLNGILGEAVSVFAGHLGELSCEKISYVIELCQREPDELLAGDLLPHQLAYALRDDVSVTELRVLENFAAYFEFQADEQDLKTKFQAAGSCRVQQFDNYQSLLVKKINQHQTEVEGDKTFESEAAIYQGFANFDKALDINPNTKQALIKRFNDLNSGELQVYLLKLCNKFSVEQLQKGELLKKQLELACYPNQSLARLELFECMYFKLQDFVGTYFQAGDLTVPTRTDCFQNLINALSNLLAEDIDGPSAINELFDLQQGRLLSAQPLVDCAASYMIGLASARERAVAKSVIHKFYRALDWYEHHNPGIETIEALWDSPSLQPLMDFSAEQTAEISHERVVLMNMLHSGSFITGYGKPSPFFVISVEKNNRLLEVALGKCSGHYETILKLASPGAGLSGDQSAALMKAADEINAMRRNTSRSTSPSVNTADGNLRQSVMRELDNYKRAGLRSSTRRGFHLLELKSAAESGLLVQSGLDYIKILNALHSAKVKAMEADAKHNNNNFVKVNSTGRSRFYRTLNRIEIMVYKHWMQHPAHWNQFARYGGGETLIKTQFSDYLKNLTNEVQAYMDRPGGYYDGAQRLFKKLFEPEKNRENIQGLLDILERVDELIHDSESASGDNSDLILANLDCLLARLPADKKILPGHITVLVDEIIPRIGFMKASIECQEPREVASAPAP